MYLGGDKRAAVGSDQALCGHEQEKLRIATDISALTVRISICGR